MPRTSEQIIVELKDLLRSKGYIYSLCLLLFDEFHFLVDQIHEQNPHQQLSMNELEKLHKGNSTSPGEKELFGRGEMLVEPTHCAGTGAYDFQLVRLIEHKYKFDLDWLLQKRGYSPQSAIDFFSCVKKRLEVKGKRHSRCY